MSDRFQYQGENSIIIQDGSIIWNDQAHDQSSLQYMDANDTIINNSTINESYVSAIDTNETQYFSILEHSNDITLEVLNNLTIGNADVQENIVLAEDIPSSNHEETSQDNDEDEDTQVVVFTIDGSDDLYGMQFAQDDEGNTQRYQFKFRTTDDGQLEAIPETIQLLANDDLVTTESESEQTETEQTELNLKQPETQKYFLVQPHLGSEKVDDSLNQESEYVQSSQRHVFIKGESRTPVEFEKSMERENFDQDLQHQSEDFVQPEEHIESIIERVNIKTERAIEVQNIESRISNNTNIKQEHFAEEQDHGQEEEEENEDLNDETIQPQTDNFSEIEQPTHIYIKQQPQEEISEEENDTYQREIVIKQQPESSDESADELSHEEIIAPVDDQANQDELVQQFMNENCQIEVEYEAEAEEQESPPEEYQDVFNGQDHQENATHYIEETNNDTDNEQYEVIKGLHVTGEENKEHQEQEFTTTNTESVLHEVIERYKEQTVDRTNILKHPVINTDKEPKLKKPLVSVKYYVVYPEKENVNSLSGNTTCHLPVPKLTKTNPRSVLRTSYDKPKRSEEYKKVATNSFPECDLFHKRFAKNKEAMRAKLFHNFLNRTTIPHAPVRQHRQPRKQEIKPLNDRSDEEIIVQEVMVSSNGFIESLNSKVKNRKFQVTAVVELSDSEDELDLNINKHRRKTHQIPRQSSESELSVIEIHSDDETNVKKKDSLEDIVKRGKGRPRKSNTGNPTILKRRRGRPPKKSELLVEGASVDFELSPSKRDLTHSEEIVPDQGIISTESEINIKKKRLLVQSVPKPFLVKIALIHILFIIT